MTVPMVGVWIVAMGVRERQMLMEMSVRFVRLYPRFVCVLMMLIVDVTVGVGQPLVIMGMLVTLGEVKPDPQTHQHCRREERHPHGLAQEQQ